MRLISAAAALAAVSIGAAQPRTVTVTIQRVSQIDNLDGDFIKADRADFYAQLSIDGSMKETKKFISDDGRPPGWSYTRRVKGNKVQIRIKLIDDDGGLEDRDDFVDINPKDGKKDLNLVLDLSTGRISGDAKGKRGQVMHVRGANDGDKGEIWFVIR